MMFARRTAAVRRMTVAAALAAGLGLGLATHGATAQAPQEAPARPRVVNELPKPWETYAARPLARAAAEPDARQLPVAVGHLRATGYTHFSVMSRGKDGRLNLFSYVGAQHKSGKESAIDYRFSTDHGATWTTRRLLDGAGQGVDLICP